jgi:hypothetical protein
MITKYDEMIWARGIAFGLRDIHAGFREETGSKEMVGRPRSKSEDNIKMGLN